MSRLATRRYKVSHSLRLTEVHLAIEESALRELARTSQTASVVKQHTDNLLLDVNRAVAAYLHDVLARERARRTEHESHNLVDVAHAVVERAVNSMISLDLGQLAVLGQTHHLVHNIQSLRARNTNNGDAAHTLRSAHRTDCIIIIVRFHKLV